MAEPSRDHRSLVGSLAIAIATFQRNEGLNALLDSVRDSAVPAGIDRRIYVVDNDPDRAAESIAQEHGDLVTRYIHEPRRGIAEARNAALDAFGDEQFVVFVDDDEVVATDWLVRLVDAMTRYDADIVWGPVIPVLPPDAPTWAFNGFYERVRYRTGTTLRAAATNNTLVKRRLLATNRFDTAYSETGGSDTELFSRLANSGAKIIWCDEAIVWENVPNSRLTVHWVRRRAIRTGNVAARVLVRDGRRWRARLGAITRLALGGAKLIAIKILRRPITAANYNTFYRGLGMWRALRLEYVREYASADHFGNIGP